MTTVKSESVAKFQAEINPLLDQLQAKCEELDFDVVALVNVPNINNDDGFAVMGRTCFSALRSPIFMAVERMLRAETIEEVMFHVLRARALTSMQSDESFNVNEKQ